MVGDGIEPEKVAFPASKSSEPAGKDADIAKTRRYLGPRVGYRFWGMMRLLLPIISGAMLLFIGAAVLRVRVDSRNAQKTSHTSPGRWPNL